MSPPEVGTHITSFVRHYLPAYDLTFERPSHNDVILLALTADPQAMVARLSAKNREELRLSPASSIDLRFEVLHNWNVNEDPNEIVSSFVNLVNHDLAEESNES